LRLLQDFRREFRLQPALDHRSARDSPEDLRTDFIRATDGAHAPSYVGGSMLALALKRSVVGSTEAMSTPQQPWTVRDGTQK